MRANISNLKVDENLFIRFGLNEEWLNGHIHKARICC